jgi:hypothetical protein
MIRDGFRRTTDLASAKHDGPKLFAGRIIFWYLVSRDLPTQDMRKVLGIYKFGGAQFAMWTPEPLKSE